MLATQPGKALFEYVPDYVVFDLETTGLSSQHDAVVEISAIKVIGGQPLYEFSTLVNPERPIPYGASSVNHITDRMVANAPVFRDAFTAFLEFAGDLPLVGHNIAAFDMKFLYRFAAEYWDLTVGNDYIDTLRMARRAVNLPSYTLSSLAEFYGIDSDGAHRALADCSMTQQVFEEIGAALKKAQAEANRCPRCGSILKRRKGRFGEFWGCSGYPECRYTLNIKGE